MSERTRLPRPEVIRIDPKEAWAKVEQLRDARTGTVDANCAHCFHGYSYAINPGAPEQIVCHEGPPLGQLLPQPHGLAYQAVPRVVSANFFCHHFKPRD